MGEHARRSVRIIPSPVYRTLEPHVDWSYDEPLTDRHHYVAIMRLTTDDSCMGPSGGLLHSYDSGYKQLKWMYVVVDNFKW